MWARRQIGIRSCPKSYITAESLGLLEEYLVRRRLGGTDFQELTARQAEAFVILDKALEEERKSTDGRTGAGNTL